MKARLFIASVLMLAIAINVNADETAAAKLSRCPAPVQKTVQQHLAGAALDEVSAESEGGDVTYNVEIVRNGKTRTFAVAPDGEFLSEQVFIEEIPVAAQNTIHAHVGKGHLKEIDKSVEDGEVQYEVEMHKANKTRHFIVAEDGRLISMDVFLNETPLDARNAIEAHIGEAKLTRIDKTADDDGVSYDVEMVKNGRSRSFSVNESGELTGEQVFLEELPAAVRKAIDPRLGDNKLGDITKSTDDGREVYDVEIKTNGRTKTVTFDAGGAEVEN